MTDAEAKSLLTAAVEELKQSVLDAEEAWTESGGVRHRAEIEIDDFTLLWKKRNNKNWGFSVWDGVAHRRLHEGTMRQMILASHRLDDLKKKAEENVLELAREARLAADRYDYFAATLDGDDDDE